MPDPPPPANSRDTPSHVGRPSPVFLSTYWPVVRAVREPGPRREEALGHLVRQYAPALKQFVRTKFNFDEDTADDLVHEFVVNKILRRDLVASAEQERGKFRTFLMKAVQNFTIDFLRREAAQKRIPTHALTSVDDLDQALPDVEADPAPEFDNAFVRQVLATAVHRLSQHCTANGQTDTWKVFYHRMLAPTLDIAEPVPYRQLADELGFANETDVRNRLTSAKRILKRELEAVVAEYVEDSAEAEEELRELRRLLG